MSHQPSWPGLSSLGSHLLIPRKKSKFGPYPTKLWCTKVGKSRRDFSIREIISKKTRHVPPTAWPVLSSLVSHLLIPRKKSKFGSYPTKLWWTKVGKSRRDFSTREIFSK